MTMDRDTVQGQALDWAVKTGDLEFDRWDEFVLWLEADPAHADAYHAIVGRLGESDAVLPRISEREAIAMPDERRPLKFAIAASLAIVGAAGAVMLAPIVTTDDYRTAPGEVRTIALDDGNQLIMNGDTRLQLAGFNRDQVHLDQGQVLLRLSGEPKVSVVAGDLAFTDIGTVFEVTRDGHRTRLLVSEGAVMADPKGAAVKVSANEMLEASDGDQTLAAKPANGEAGSWTEGQLSYVDAPVPQVLADLHRSTGLVFSPSGAMSARRYSGTLSASGIRSDPASLGPLLGVSVRRSGNRWEVGEE